MQQQINPNTPPQPTTYGTRVGKSPYGLRGILSLDPEPSGGGNIIIRSLEARDADESGFVKVGHNVLTATEARDMADELNALADWADTMDGAS